MAAPSRPAPPRPAAGTGAPEPLLRGGERERERVRVLSAHVTRRARSPLPLLAALPCPPSAGARRRPRSRERVSGPTGCWRSGGGGEEEPAAGRARRRGRARRKARRALAAERCLPGAGAAGPGGRCPERRPAPRADPRSKSGNTEPRAGVCSPPEAAGDALGALMHRPGPAAAVRKVNKNVIMCFLVGARNERGKTLVFSRRDLRNSSAGSDQHPAFEDAEQTNPRSRLQETDHDTAPEDYDRDHDPVVRHLPIAGVFIYNSSQRIFLKNTFSIFVFEPFEMFVSVPPCSKHPALFLREHLILLFAKF